MEILCDSFYFILLAKFCDCNFPYLQKITPISHLYYTYAKLLSINKSRSIYLINFFHLLDGLEVHSYALSLSLSLNLNSLTLSHTIVYI
jgi:hypothetical protein